MSVEPYACCGITCCSAHVTLALVWNLVVSLFDGYLLQQSLNAL